MEDLLILTLLWCNGSYEEKSRVLFEIINPSDQTNTTIAALDKDWDRILDQIVYIASSFTYI